MATLLTPRPGTLAKGAKGTPRVRGMVDVWVSVVQPRPAFPSQEQELSQSMALGAPSWLDAAVFAVASYWSASRTYALQMVPVSEEARAELEPPWVSISSTSTG
jgi:hypothetical protein